MDFELTSEQVAMRDMAKRLAEREFAPLLARHDPDTALPKAVFLQALQTLAPLGLTAPRLPAEAGGAGISMLDYGLVFEQLTPQIGMNLLSHEGCVSRLFTECSEQQRSRFLPALIAGRKIGCTGSTEPDTGSDPRGIKTRLHRDGGKFRLRGRKMWITNASVCDLMIVTCIDARERKDSRSVIKVVVERETSPFETREIETIGLRQGYLGEAVFDDCEIPEDNLIVSSEGGTAVLKKSWSINRPLVGLQAVHLAQKALDAAIEYAKVRTAFGKAIAGHQLIQKNLSDMATSVTASRLLCYSALARADQGLPVEGSSAMAKRFAQTTCEQVVWQAMNVFGALGLSREAGLERLYRDARMLSIPDGTNELLALIHGRELTGIEAFRGTAAKDAASAKT